MGSVVLLVRDVNGFIRYKYPIFRAQLITHIGMTQELHWDQRSSLGNDFKIYFTKTGYWKIENQRTFLVDDAD